MRRTILMLASMAIVLVLASSAAFALLTYASGGPIQRVAIARESSNSLNTFFNTEYVGVPGTGLPVNVPNDTTRLVMARFSAASVCSGGTGPQSCMLRFVAENNVTNQVKTLQPDAGGGTVFDSTNAGSETLYSDESHSMDRSLRLGPGSWTVSVQQRVTNSHVRFILSEWSFTVEQSQ